MASPQTAAPPCAETEYLAGGIRYRIAGADDEAQLRALLRDNPMDAWIRLGMQREPAYFDGSELMGPSSTVLATTAQPPHTVVGMYGYGTLPVHLNGAATAAGYLHGLRVAPAFRRRLRILAGGFTSMRRLLPQPHPVRLTSIASDNQAARRLLEAGLPDLPQYRPAGELLTLAMRARARPHAPGMRRAIANDVPALCDWFNARAAAMQFAPALSPAWLMALDGRHGLTIDDFWLDERGGDIQGCFALWDQRRVRQTVVRGYRFPLDMLRKPYNLWAAIARRPHLPPPGRMLDAVFIAFPMVADPADRDALAELIGAALALAHRRGAALGLLGRHAEDGTAALLRRRYRATDYRSRIYTVGWPDEPAPPLDGRPAQPEIAVL